MPRYVALLRGIMPMNPKHRMERLRGLFEQLGFTRVQSVIASGNIVFDTLRTDRKQLEADIEKALFEANGIQTATIVRTKHDIKELIDTNPFRSVSESKREKPNLTFFKASPDQSKLPAQGRGFTGYGYTAGAYCYTVDMTALKTPEAMLTLEKLFGNGITTRTWGTVEKIWAKMQEDE